MTYLDEHISIMTERKSLSAAKIKKDVSVSVNDKVALALVAVSKGVNLGCILVSVQVILLEDLLVP